MQAEVAYCACATPGRGLGSGAPLRDAQTLQEAVQEAAFPRGPHLPPSRLQVRPVSFGNVSLKRSPTPASPEILKDNELEPTGHEMKCGPNFYHVLQNSLNPLPLWVGLRAGAAALETVWRLLRKSPIELPCDPQVHGLELTPKIQMQ